MINKEQSQLGVDYKALYTFICENSANNFRDKFQAEDLLFLVQFHSHNKDGYLSFTDFNQMVLPTCNQQLRAEAT